MRILDSLGSARRRGGLRGSAGTSTSPRTGRHRIRTTSTCRRARRLALGLHGEVPRDRGQRAARRAAAAAHRGGDGSGAGRGACSPRRRSRRRTPIARWRRNTAACSVYDKAHDYLRTRPEARPEGRHDARRAWRGRGAMPGSRISAMGDAHRAIYYAPKSAAARNTLGTLFQALGRRAEARTQYERASSSTRWPATPTTTSATAGFSRATRRGPCRPAAARCRSTRSRRSRTTTPAWPTPWPATWPPRAQSFAHAGTRRGRVQQRHREPGGAAVGRRVEGLPRRARGRPEPALGRRARAPGTEHEERRHAVSTATATMHAELRSVRRRRERWPRPACRTNSCCS